MDTDKIRAITVDCTQLVYRAMHHTDAARWEELVALYAENGKLTRPTEPDNPIVGRASILASLRARPPLTTRHLISNVVVDVQSDAAARITSTIVRFSGPVKTTSPTRVEKILIGTFVDEVALIEGSWKFVSRGGSMGLELNCAP
jgi:hypothetical protein